MKINQALDFVSAAACTPEVPDDQGGPSGQERGARARERLLQIDGAMPRLNAIPAGCAFNPRCPQVMERCRRERPDLSNAGRTRAACWLHATQGAAA